ncbi:MAG: protein-L-isoaspartate O-methyltransferase [Candidatus Portnoybacteria bacterium]|nr:protein-L-isoaspartate O-methyltransferase [Candidatus Portnoybacteria bacterium]
MTNRELVESLIRGGYLKSPQIIKAFKKIDRADFVPEDSRHEAYINAPLPIGQGQTISQPLTVAFMMELLEPEAGNIILDIGSGSGWQTAILAEIVGKKGKVFGIERIPKLTEIGKNNIERYKFISSGRVEIFEGDGTLGLPDKAPFDRIIAAASGEKIIEAWKKQLKINGRVVAPIENSIFLLVKKAENEFEEKEYPGFAFVPLISDKDKEIPEWRKHFMKPNESR